jgi:hypothetical protein
MSNPSSAPPASRSTSPARFLSRRALLTLVVVVAAAVAAMLLAALLDQPHSSTAPLGSVGAAPAGTFHSPDADLVILDGVSGTVSITAEPTAHSVTGVFTAAQGAQHSVMTPHLDTRHQLTLLCTVATVPAPCAGALAITVPQHTALRLRQTSGETDLQGIGGDLSVTVASDRLTAAGLRSPTAAFAVISSSADLQFALPPDQLSAQVSSSSTTVGLPVSGGDTYAVTMSAASADVQVQVPQDAGSAHRVGITTVSGSVDLLPSAQLP